MTRGGLHDLALRGRDALQEGHAEPLREGRRDDAAAGAVGSRHGDQTHYRAGRAVSGIGSHGSSSPPDHAMAGATSGAAGARRPEGSTSPHTIAAAAKMPAETQNATM